MLKKKNQAIVEYLVLVAAIIIVVIVAANGDFGKSVLNFFNNAGNAIGNIGK